MRLLTLARLLALTLFLFFISSAAISVRTTTFNNQGRLAEAVIPAISATLTDAFPDPNGDGRAAAGAEVTYTARITNSGNADATGVSFTAPVGDNSTVVPGSLEMQPDLNPHAIRCTFSTGGNADCNGGGSYAATDSNLNTILSAQNDYLTLNPSNVSYNAGTGVFQFDVTVQNLLPEALGTLDNATLDAAGVRLFLQNSKVTSGTGSVAIANADGTGTFSDANQPYFQYNQILQQDQVSDVKTVQVNVPNTVGSFTLDFFVSTKAQVKVVINEVLVNPGGTITDANGEWFEIYNAGRLPVNLRNFLINDSGPALGTPGEECFEVSPGRCYRPPFTVATNLTMESGAYLVFGNTTNTTLNGGVPVDYSYGSTMNLVSDKDSVRIRTPAATGALRIDKTQYSQANVSAQNGISRELKNPALDNANMDGSNWADADVRSVYGPGGRGTPKAQNYTYTPAHNEDNNVDNVDPGLSWFDTNLIQPESVVKKSSGALQTKLSAGETVSANIGTITPRGFATVTYRVTIANPLPAGTTQISTQGTVSGGNFTSLLTDDPATGTSNDATVIPLETLETQSSISGTVSYGTTPAGQSKFVSNVLMSAGGTNSTNTNSSGTYVLENLTTGNNYTVTPSKTGNINGITAFDATLVLRCVAAGNSCALTENQKTAADADGDANVTAFDATQILRFVAANGQNANTGQTGNWKFIDPSKPYNPLPASQTNQHYTAFLIGEVDGDWAP